MTDIGSHVVLDHAFIWSTVVDETPPMRMQDVCSVLSVVLLNVAPEDAIGTQQVNKINAL